MSVFETISRPLFNGGVFRTDLLAETHYFYCTFNTGYTPKDKISRVHMQTTGLAAGRVSYHGGPYGINEPEIDKYGLFGCGVIENLVDNPEDTSQWSGSGPWTNTVTVGTGTHTLSTDIDGAMVSIAAGTATIDGVASATYGNPANFEVTGAGTITIQTDTADPKAQITATEYKLPYVNGLSPENFSDADQGYKFPIENQLLDALYGCVSDELNTESPDVGYIAVGSVDNKLLTNASTRTTKWIPVDPSTTYKIYGLTADRGCIQFKSDTDVITYSDQSTNYSPPPEIITTDADTAYVRIYYSYTGDSELSFKQVSPAQGKLTVKWRPMFSSGDLTGTINILTANDEASSFLFFDADNDLLKLTDGTNTSHIACSPVAGTEYEIIAQYDETNGMVISLDGTAGTTVAFAGRFPNAYDLSYFWEAEAPQYVKITSIEKESGL